MPSREYGMWVQETSYGIANATPVKGTSLFYPRLDGPNSFTAASNPVILDIMYGGGRATPAFAVSDQRTTTGRFTSLLYAGAYSRFLMDLAFTVIDSGRTAPWTTTDASKVMPPGDLASASFYHARQFNDDGSYNLRRYGGGKCISGSLEMSRAEPRVRLNMDLAFITDATKGDGTAGYPNSTEFPAPAETDYPTNPYLFSHSGGNCKINNVVWAKYDSLSLSWRNVVDIRYFESTTPVLMRFLGRETHLRTKLFMQTTPDVLAAYQALTTQTTSLLKLNNGTNTITLALNTNNLIKALPRDLPLDRVFEWDLDLQNYWDPSAATDVTLSST